MEPLSAPDGNDSAPAVPGEAFTTFVGIGDGPDDEEALGAAVGSGALSEKSAGNDDIVDSRGFGLNSAPPRVVHSTGSEEAAPVPEGAGNNDTLGSDVTEPVAGGDGAIVGGAVLVDPSGPAYPAGGTEDIEEEAAVVVVVVAEAAGLLPTAPNDEFIRV